MIEHPPIPGRRTLTGDLLDIHDDLMRMIVRLDLLGERRAAISLVEAVEHLVDAPPALERPIEEIEELSVKHDAYEEQIKDNRFGSMG